MSVAEDLKTKPPEQILDLAREALRQELVDRERLRREVRQIVDAESRPPRPPLRALTLNELFARRGADYIVDQLLPEGALAELVGDSESLKSFLSIDLCLTVASGQPHFFGQRVVKQGPVLYIAAEGEGAFQYRVRAWGQARGVDLTDVPFRTIAAPVDLRDAHFQNELQAIVADLQPVLLVVDTLHRCMPGAEENSARDLGEVVAFASRLKAMNNVAVLFLHHPPKNTPGGRGRGSSALYYAADTELSAVVIGKEQPNGVKVVEFAVKKQKDDEKLRFVLTNRIVPVLDALGRPMAHASGRPIQSCVLEFADDAEVEQLRRGDQLMALILAHVDTHPGCSKNDVVKAIGGNRNTVLKQIKDLLAAERLALDDDNGLHISSVQTKPELEF